MNILTDVYLGNDRRSKEITFVSYNNTNIRWKRPFEMHYIRCYLTWGMRVYFNKNTYVQMIDVSQFRQENETFRKLQITATICY